MRDYIFIILAATIFLFTSFTKSFSQENVFTIDNVEINESISLNFSRENYLDKAFKKSFQILMEKILLEKDLRKIKDVNLKQIKNLILSFQIIEESYSSDKYNLITKVIYSDKEVKKFLGEKNLSFSQPENISVVFFPLLIINNEIQSFNDNYFYREWQQIKIKNTSINFILPIEDLDDISKMTKIENEIEKLDISDMVNKYDVQNYVFALMDYQNAKLNVHLKINFKNNKINKNIFYQVEKVEDSELLNSVAKDLKLKITDLWKQENLVNVLMPLLINVKFEHRNLGDLDNLKDIFSKITIIDKYTLEEFNTNSSFFKIYYYGNPRKFKSELLKFGYQLKNDQGFLQIYINE